MTRKETVRAAISHRKTDHVPYHLDYAPPTRKRLQEHYRVEDIERIVGSYLVWLVPPKDWKIVGKNLERDEFGVVWSTNEFNRGYVADHPLKEPTLDGYAFPDYDRPARYAFLADAVERHRGIFTVVVVGDLLERAGFMRGLDHILMDLYVNPAFVEDLLDALTDSILKNIEAICKYDVDGLFLSDDYGLQHGPMMSPEMWDRFLQPRVAKIFAEMKSHGKAAILHSCGNVRAFIPGLIEAGLDVLHPIQPEAMDIYELKETFGDRLCLYGGVRTQTTLPHGTPAEVKEEVRRVAERMSKGGGFVLGPGITLQHDIPLENLLAFIEAAQAL
ncbi:MAG: uroporphyrinogen decarboxylase family protein [Planctomycetota bacterium]